MADSKTAQLILKKWKGKIGEWCLFIPEIYGYIPLSVSVNREPPVEYETPPTVRDQLKAAQKTDTTGTSEGTT
ncbi:MAG: hypothetical protein ACNYWU_05880 [Desulfobacterales bacterium]